MSSTRSPGPESWKNTTFRTIPRIFFMKAKPAVPSAAKLSALRSLFRYLMKMKKIDKNPAKLVRNPKRELRHPTALNVDQMFTLLDEASVESGGAAGLDGSRQAEQAVTDREHARAHPAIWRWRNCSTVPGCVFPKLSIWMWTMWTRQAVSSGS